MWLDHLQGREKIKFMFNDELSLDDSEFENLLFYDLSKVRLCFKVKNIPKKTPEKWKQIKFNGISITLELIAINNLILNGNRVGFMCSPLIHQENNKFIFTITNKEEFFFSCTTDVIFIDSIYPYWDQRWK